MLIIPIMVTSASNGLETIVTIGINDLSVDDDPATYQVTVNGVIKGEVTAFDRDRGAIALVHEALEAIELHSDRSKTFISRSEQRRKQ